LRRRQCAGCRRVEAGVPLRGPSSPEAYDAESDSRKLVPGQRRPLRRHTASKSALAADLPVLKTEFGQWSAKFEIPRQARTSTAYRVVRTGIKREKDDSGFEVPLAFAARLFRSRSDLLLEAHCSPRNPKAHLAGPKNLSEAVMPVENSQPASSCSVPPKEGSFKIQGPRPDDLLPSQELNRGLAATLGENRLSFIRKMHL
jgi:hypothetical protein